jgi:hypothetical protein
MGHTLLAGASPWAGTNGRLLAANLLQTALLFQDIVDFRIHFNYSLFHPTCGKQISPISRYWAYSTIDLARAFAAVVKKLMGSANQ